MLGKISKLTLGLEPNNNLKRVLGLSSRAIAHEWTSAGVGSIKGYSTWIENAAKSARYMKMGGWVAIGFSGVNATNKVYNSCTTGRENECSKVAVREYSIFGASLAGGVWGGQAGAGIATGICVALGVATGGAGALACAIVGAAVGAYAASEATSYGTEVLMDKIL
ncbi:hypothetical protein [Phytobacter sp. V91]|uniref:hypothetical protein n=1 Tax=Phytobacter sp. V91 TaxID=3369425 RepID=UPI003F62ED04